MITKRNQMRCFAPLAYSQSMRTDTANRAIFNICAMQVGEAIGHGKLADTTTLSMAAALGNAGGRIGKVWSRFGHPEMSENATGRKVGYAANFRLSGDKLLCDLHLSEAAKLSPVFERDPADYLLHVANHAPEEMGMSAVLWVQLVWRFADGSEEECSEDWYYGMAEESDRPAGAINHLPLMRPVAFDYLDVVNEGALTPNGMFAAQLAAGHSSEFLFTAYDMIDRFRVQYRLSLEETKDKLETFVVNYLKNRGLSQEQVTMAAAKKPRGKQVFFEAEGVIGSESELNETPDELDGALAQAEENTAVIEETDTAMNEAEETEQSAELQRLQVQVDKLSRLALLQNQQITALSQQVQALTQATVELRKGVQALANEPIITAGVPQFARGVFGANLQNVPPISSLPNPHHISEEISMDTSESASPFGLARRRRSALKGGN